MIAEAALVGGLFHFENVSIVKMLWGGGEGCGTFGAVQQLPTERPHVAIL
jgi:hypothetical protein